MQNFVGKTKCIVGYMKVADMLHDTNEVVTVTEAVESAGVETTVPRGLGVLPCMGYIGMCGPKGYRFSAVLVINRVSILTDFGHFGHK